MRSIPCPHALASVLLSVAACTAPGPVGGNEDGAGAGEGEGEGDVSAEGEGEGDVVAEGEGEGEGAPSDVPLAGFGAIAGDCGVLSSELTSATPSFHANVLDFGTDRFDVGVDDAQLTDGGERMLHTPNAGGNSLLSEVFALEVLTRCEGASLFKTETEVQYTTTQTKITDFVVTIDGERYGVSVLRAFTFPPGSAYTLDVATEKLQGKLDDILVSSANVAPADAWHKQVLAVLAWAPDHVDTLRAAWDALDPATRADTIVLVTTTSGDDAVLYCNPSTTAACVASSP